MFSPRAPKEFEEILGDIRSHLGINTPSYARFLTLVDHLLMTHDPCRTSEIISSLAQLLRNIPTVLYRLGPLLKPHSRIDVDIRYSPATSLVLKTLGDSRIIILDSDYDASPTLHNMSTSQLREILVHSSVGDSIYDALHRIANPALRGCLAQLAQEVLDESDLPKNSRRKVLDFLRQLDGVPPSLLLPELKQLDPFAHTVISDLYHGIFDGSKVVIKKLRLSQELLNDSEILREVILCRQFQHPNILPFLGAHFDRWNKLNSLAIVYMKNGNVIQFLESHPNVDRLTLVWQIMKGLEFLHNFHPPIAHRKLKGTNVLVSDKMACCISDFGLSSMPELAQRSRDYAVNTMPWMAPEVLVSPEIGRLDLFKVDIFSLGITVHEIYTGKPPLFDQDFLAVYTTRVAQREVPSLPLDCPFPPPPFLSELVEMMLDYDPSKRPPIRMISQGLEDSFHFPREIEGLAVDSSADQDRKSNSSSVQLVAQEWLKKERRRMYKSKTRTRTSSSSSTRTARSIVGLSSKGITKRPLRVMSPPSNLDESVGPTNLPFSRAVIPRAPAMERFGAPSLTMLAQGSSQNILTPSDSPHAALAILQPRPTHLPERTPLVPGYTEFGLYYHLEGSLSPPPSPTAQECSRCSPVPMGQCGGSGNGAPSSTLHSD